MKLSLGVGMTNACNLACAHCYRSLGTDALSVEQVLEATEAVPTRAVNFGTGENGLHPDFPRVVRELDARGIGVTMTTNGYSAKVLDDDVLRLFKDVEFSIDYPSKDQHDLARGDGNWELIQEQMQRCRGLGVATTIVSVLMAPNHLAMPALLELAGSRGAFLRINVYQSSKRDQFTLSFEEFWTGFSLLFEHGDLITCGEPIVRAMLGIPRAEGAGCGRETVRITPRGAIVPCVYGADDALGLADLGRLGGAVVDAPSFARLRVPPPDCAACPHLATCGGGCPTRRSLRGRPDAPDAYCPIVRGREIALRARHIDAGRALTKAASACTTVLRARGV